MLLMKQLIEGKIDKAAGKSVCLVRLLVVFAGLILKIIVVLWDLVP